MDLWCGWDKWCNRNASEVGMDAGAETINLNKNKKLNMKTNPFFCSVKPVLSGIYVCSCEWVDCCDYF